MKKILVIEDDRIMRENTVELLQITGYEVQSAENGKEGISKAKEFKPQLIICDIMMPEIDGYSVLHAIRNEKQSNIIPFIFLTAKSENEDLRKGMELGADDYLTKPFKDVELLSAVKGRLEKQELIEGRLKSNEEDSSNDSFQHFVNQAGEVLSMQDLSKEFIEHILENRESLYRSGDHANYLYFVKKGKVKTYLISESGKEFITGIFSEGDYFGYREILQESSHEEFAEVIENSVVLKLSKSHFLKLIHENKEIAEQFMKLISKNLVEKEKELMHLAYSSVRKRIALKVLELAEEDTNRVISISRTDLARIVGTSKETLVRTLTEFRDAGIIENQNQNIVLLDKEKLEQLEKGW